MKAMQVFGPKHLRIVDAPAPKPEAGQLLIKSEVLSVCGSDMRTFRYAFPEEEYPLAYSAPCHECVGIVAASNSPDTKVGQRVIALSALPGGVPGSGMGAEYAISSPERVILLPDGADPAKYIMCQPVGTVLYAVRRIGNVLGQTVAVLGQGVIGLSFTRLLAQMGAGRVIAIDHHDYRLAKSKEQGATHVINSNKQDPIAAVKEITGGLGADLVVEAAGQEETINMIKDLVKLYGTVSLFGLPEEPMIEFDYVGLMRRQVTIVANVSSSSDDPTGCIKDTVAMVEQGTLDLSWLVTHRLPFDEAPRAYEMYESYQEEIIKVVLSV